MDADRWQRIEALYEAAATLQGEERNAYLRAHCGGDESLHREVVELLFHDEHAGNFLRVPTRFKPLESGQTLGHFEVGQIIGEGGMGAVYRAYDRQLHRPVALKVLPAEFAGNLLRRRRLLREARMASTLIHPNIVAIYEVGSDSGVDFIAMELVEGKTLRELIPERGMPVLEALEGALQIAQGLAKAHAAGVVHRDLKPSNVMVTSDGVLKLLDFGLARTVRPVDGESTLSVEGGIAGTPAYMSPEQAEGKPVDPRSDVFGFGSVLYEMLSGQRAFQRESGISTLSAILHEAPAPLSRRRVPRDVDRILKRCLEKDRGQRYASAAELAKELETCRARVVASNTGWRGALQQPKIMAASVVAMILLLAAVGWAGLQAYRAHWARTVALPEIARLSDQEFPVGALRLAWEVDRVAPAQVELRSMRRDLWIPYSISTEPEGAEVWVRDYKAERRDWQYVGKSPLANLRMPVGNLVVRAGKPGYAEVEGTMDAIAKAFRRKLHPKESAPPEMVFVPTGTFPVQGKGTVKGGPFWLDRYEVTNRQYKQFVDAGGYQKREFWQVPFEDGTRVLPWDQAMARFVDSTGRSGPSNWDVGSYAEGHAEDPVAGVSWYEAAAYAAFAGKSLPTVYHWAAAAEFAHFSTIMLVSNFQGGPGAVGAHAGVGRYGTYDMAGNVAEWCWNQAGKRRLVRGGAWDDPAYMYIALDAAAAMDRSTRRGFRCAKYSAEVPDALMGEVDVRQDRNRSMEQPSSDEVFRVYRSMFDYDRRDLEARVEAVDESSPWWRKERVSFDAAYGNQRMIAFVFLPRIGKPPYRTILFFPGATAQRERTSDNLELRRLDFLLRSGYAVVYPVYEAMYERNAGVVARPLRAVRELRIHWVQDASRALDYLESRADLDRSRVGYFGVSTGAGMGPLILVADPRLKLGMLQGLALESSDGMELPGELRMANYLPRIRVPMLVMNGKDDLIAPPESQIAAFRLLGTPDAEKRRVVFNSGHALPRAEAIREMLAWLERCWGRP